jgi:CDP-diacylglycerol--serine O-phosphatidyltransferase
MLLSLKKITRKQYKKSLSTIPCILTFLNAILGFLSIVKSFEGNYKAAAYYLIAAALLDGFDGRLARAFGSTSYFGMELDSLSDAISFCRAPMVLVYCWGPLEGTLSKLLLAFYLCAGLGRLARFNSTADQQQHYFIGLPTTIAAFFISSLVLSERFFVEHQVYLREHPSLLLAAVGCSALLMISPIRFMSGKKLTRPAPSREYTIVLGVLFLAWCVIRHYPLWLCLSGSYIGLHCWIFCCDAIKKLYASNS